MVHGASRAADGTSRLSDKDDSETKLPSTLSGKPKQPTAVNAAAKKVTTKRKGAKKKAAKKKAAKKKVVKQPAKKKGKQVARATGRADKQPAATENDVRQILRVLKRDYGDAECALHHETPEQLLIATILSAQCTDERVNLVTAQLFAEYPDPASLAQAPLETIEKLVQSTGFFRNKAKNIKACCMQLVERYDGRVPQELEALVRLPGVGRKTANVVLGTAFGIPSGVVVDTHVGRISRRLGLTPETDPVKAERDLMQRLPKKQWIMYSHRVIHHGRRVCRARKPACDRCGLDRWCPRIGVANTG